jgi:hypothetical protein
MVASFPRYPDVLAITTVLLGQQQAMAGQQQQQLPGPQLPAQLF